MSGPETIFKKKVLADLRKIPGSWWVKIQQVSISGTPDILGCVGRLFVAIEMKKSLRERPTPLQVYNLMAISDAGAVAIAVAPENWDVAYARLVALSRPSKVE